MYFSLKSDCYFRRYGSIGYILRPIISMEEVVNECGALFIDQLQYEPRAIDEIADNLSKVFPDVEIAVLKRDAVDFYMDLAKDGFLNYSESFQEFKNTGFEYSALEEKLVHKTFRPQLEETSSHFLGEYFKENPYLETFHIELTSKCNERCIHCYIPHEKKDTDISYDLMIKALDQCKEMGVLTVVFSGGEPILHPHFCDFLRYAKDLDFNVTILSNLTVINDKIIEAFKYRHASCVNVSLYSMDPQVHDSITTVFGSFEKTKSNILKLISQDVPVQINCPVMKQNKDSFHKVINWGQQHKCRVNTDYLIMGRCDHSTDNLDNRLTPDDLADVIRNLLNVDVVLQSHLEAGSDSIEGNIKPDDRVCGVGMTTLCMVAGGDIYPCAGWQGYHCGNLNKQTLREIWETSPEVDYLRNLRQRDFSKCINCKDHNYCLMCMSRNANENPDGNIFQIPEITCDAAHVHHKIVEEYRKGKGLK